MLTVANRYVTSAAPLLLVLTALGIGELTTRAGRRLGPWLASAFAVGAGAAALDWLPVERLEIASSTELRKVALVTAVAGLVLALTIRRARPAVATAAAVLLAAVVVVQPNAVPGRSWLRYNALGLPLDQYWARAGLTLRETTSPTTTIAVVGAGNTPYLSERPTIDLLGKMDPVIASGGIRRPDQFWPGHSKWNFDHSIGRLRPAVVLMQWRVTPAELCDLVAWGYEHVGGEFFVRRGAPGVDPAVLGERFANPPPVRVLSPPARCPAGA